MEPTQAPAYSSEAIAMRWRATASRARFDYKVVAGASFERADQLQQEHSSHRSLRVSAHRGWPRTAINGR